MRPLCRRSAVMAGASAPLWQEVLWLIFDEGTGTVPGQRAPHGLLQTVQVVFQKVKYVQKKSVLKLCVHELAICFFTVAAEL